MILHGIFLAETICYEDFISYLHSSFSSSAVPFGTKEPGASHFSLIELA